MSGDTHVIIGILTETHGEEVVPRRGVQPCRGRKYKTDEAADEAEKDEEFAHEEWGEYEVVGDVEHAIQPQRQQEGEEEKR